MINVLKPGTLTTIQSRPRSNLRHRGVPSGGAADRLSLALANRLVGNSWDAPALETTLIGPVIEFEQRCSVAITGGTVDAKLNGIAIDCHATVDVNVGDTLSIGVVSTGTRSYVAFSGGLDADVLLGSASTNLQAGFGGHQGRAIAAGDQLGAGAAGSEILKTPAEYRLIPSHGVVLRACESAETHHLDDESRQRLFSENWQVDQRADRMGIKLDGEKLQVETDGRMPSAPVFSGTVQCPENGAPYLLSVDAGTVGGYPRVAQVARLDRHLIGQLRPGDRVRFARTEPDAALAALRQKHDYWREWLPDIHEII